MAASMRFRSYALNQARQNLSSNDYSAAFSHYLLALKLDHDKYDEIYEEFVSCMCQWTELLDELDPSGLSNAFSQAKAVCCFSDSLMIALVKQALRLDKLSIAVNLMQEAQQLFPQSILVKETWEHVSYAAVERWHFKMLNDVYRNRAYHDAIVSTVQKNALSSVLDIGCGTGLLSVFAEKGGAKHITLCDAAPAMTEICSAVVASHRQQTQSTAQLRVFEARSTTLSVPEHIPERVDLVVTEIFDAALFGEHCLSSLSHAWSHLLHRGPHRKGQVIPRAAEMYVCAIQCPEIRKENWVQQNSLPLMDLRGVHITSRTCVADDEPYTTEDLYFVRNSYTFLSPVQPFMRVDFNDPQNLERLSIYSEDLLLDVYAEGTVDALAVWFDLDLCEGVKVSTGPSDRCCWEQAIFPVVTVGGEGKQATSADSGAGASLKVNCGDQLKIRCTLNDGCLRLQVQDVVALGYFLNSCRISGPSPGDTEHTCSQNSQSARCTERGHSHVHLSSQSLEEVEHPPVPDQSHQKTSHSGESSVVTGDSRRPDAPKPSIAAEKVRGCRGHEPSSTTEGVGGYTVRQPCGATETFTEKTECCDDSNCQLKQTQQNCSGSVERGEVCPAERRREQINERRRTYQDRCSDDVDMDGSDNAACEKLSISVLCHCQHNHTPTHCSGSEHKTHKLSHVQCDKLSNISPTDSTVLNGQPISACVGSTSLGDLSSHNSCCEKGDISVCVNGVRTGKYKHCSNHVCGDVHVDSVATEPRRDTSSCAVGIPEDLHNISKTHVLSPDSSESTLLQSESNNSNSIQNHDLSSQTSIQHGRSDTFYLQREEIRHLNDIKFNSLSLSALQHAQTLSVNLPSLTVISSSPPLSGLSALKSGFNHAAFCYAGDSDREEVEGLMHCVGRRNGISGSQWKWCGGGVGDAVEENVGDVVCVDVVEMTGCLRAGLLNDLRDLRSAVSKDVVMIPQALDIYAILIDSQQLHSMSRVTSDENTLGVSIAPHINPFQTQTFLDLDIHALPHENLSDVIHVFHLDFQSCVTSVLSSARSPDGLPVPLEFSSTGDSDTVDSVSDGLESSVSSSKSAVDALDSVFSQTKQLQLSVHKSGKATAVAFWFDQRLAPGVNASTVDPAMNWRQAAFLLTGETVREGQELMVTAHLEKSYLHFSLG